MEVFNYHPWTMIYLNLSPSIGLVANWNQWSEAETDLIKHVKADNSGQKLTMLNFLEPKMKVPIVSNDGLQSLGEREGISRIINYTVPVMANQKQASPDVNNFEPLKNMLHLKKIYILKNHPLLKQMQQIYQPQQIVVLDFKDHHTFLNQLKRDLLEGNLENYRQLVGANYSFSGAVVHGNQSGKKLGYPTANLLMDPPLPIKSGVYLVRVSLPNDQNKHWGLGDYRQLANQSWVFETSILDFDKDIYGWMITIELVAFHRSNQKFKDLNDLKTMIQADEIALRKLIKKFEER